MKRTLVMADIHGMYRAFQQCLERAGFNEEEDTLIQLGDIADRGPETFEVVERLLSIKNLISIRGNHDEWFLTWLQTGAHPGRTQGGAESIASYVKNCPYKQDNDFWNKTGLAIPDDHFRFFHDQKPWYKDDEKNLFVHGGMNRHLTLAEHKDPMVFWWDRDLWHTAMSYHAMTKGLVYNEPGGGNVAAFKVKEPCKNIYIGHTPTLLWQETAPMKRANVTNLDTGAGMGGKLTIMDIETGEYWQSDLVADLYGPAQDRAGLKKMIEQATIINEKDEQHWNG